MAGRNPYPELDSSRGEDEHTRFIQGQPRYHPPMPQPPQQYQQQYGEKPPRQYPQYPEQYGEKPPRQYPEPYNPQYPEPTYPQQVYYPPAATSQPRSTYAPSQMGASTYSLFSAPTDVKELKKRMREEKFEKIAPDDYLWLSCIVLLFCNVIFGAFAVFYSCYARNYTKKGLKNRKKKYELWGKAYIHGKTARNIAIVGIVVTFALLIVAIGVLVHVSKIMIDVCGDYFC